MGERCFLFFLQHWEIIVLSGFFKSERSKYTGVIWHVKIKSLGRGHTHKNALDEVGRKMLGARGPRNTIANFLPPPHLRFCLAACRSKDFPSQGRLLRAEGQEWLLALRQHPLPCHLSSSLPWRHNPSLQGCFILITPVSIPITPYQALEWKT